MKGIKAPVERKRASLEHAAKRLAEIGDQIGGIFEADMQPNDRFGAAPVAVLANPRRRRNEREALKAAPRSADPEEPQRIHERARLRRLCMPERKRNESVGALEIALPQRVAWIVG